MGHPPLHSQAISRLEVELPGHAPVPVWDTSASDRLSMLCPNKILKILKWYSVTFKQICGFHNLKLFAVLENSNVCEDIAPLGSQPVGPRASL